MLKNIKSAYFNNILFSFIEERQKLKIIKCNKELQKNINISIINYKYISEKYIIYESKGIGKEYNAINDTLEYEGEFLNGQRQGKGKEYGGEELKYEGEYLNGKKHGKGREYNEGKLIYEGEYLNGKKNGKGKEYNEDGKLIFEGE